MQRKLGWDDLRDVLAIGRAGSLAGAARSLQVNHSTMFRRIAAIEDKLGVCLFDRRRDGYVPTAAGEAVLALAGRMDEDVVALERRLAGEDLRPSGLVRFTTTDTLTPWVVPLCARFAEVHPQILVEFVTGSQLLNLSRREADIALRPSVAPPENLHGRRVASVTFGIYAAEPLASAPEAAPWIGFEDSLAHLRAYSWITDNVAPERIAFRTASFTAAVAAAASGMGLALLPCYLGDASPALRRLGGRVPGLVTDLWLLVHQDLRRTARVRAFADFLYAELVAMRPLLEGRD
ncbi:MAG TPA: LysR family transcriptional regulator [Allosphingosinicella sp.]